MYNLITLIIFLNYAGTFGWAIRPTEYKRVYREFDRVGAETIFKDANSLINNHSQDIQPARKSYVEVYPLTNSLSVFGSSARVRPNRISMTTAGMGSFRAGIGIVISTNSTTNGTAHYYSTRNTGEGYHEIPIYPREDRD